MANYSFSGLQTFAFKSLRLRQGNDFVVQNSCFNTPDAAICLAVIKNMDSSIRYWLIVCKTINYRMMTLQEQKGGIK